jgi:hypothetical protein
MTNISSIRATPCDITSFAELDASAKLVARNGRDAQIAQNDYIRSARIAFGCIVQPEPGDQVLISVADGTIWIISVLERNSTAPTRLCAQGDVELISTSGEVTVIAAGALHLTSGTQARLAAPDIALHAGCARFVLDELVQIGRSASVFIGKLRFVSDLIETFAEHALTRVKRSSRFVEESDQLRADNVDYRAEGVMQMRAETMLMTADTVVRVDAEQIHMG